MERKTKFLFGTRMWRFKANSRYRRTQLQSQTWKMQPQLLTELKSDLESFHKILSALQFDQLRDPGAFYLFSSHSFAIKLSSRVWGSKLRSRRGTAGLSAPRGRGGAAVAVLMSEPCLPGRVEILQREYQDALALEMLDWLVIGYLWKQAGSWGRLKSRVFSSALCWGSVKTDTAQLCPPCKAAAEVSSFSHVPPTED